VGGRRLVVGGAEYTHWVGENWGVAAFVDAGDAWDKDAPFDAALGYGLGARFRTPIGPARADLAWNPYGRQAGALYREEEDGGLTLVTDDFSAPRASGFTFHFAVGHAF